MKKIKLTKGLFALIDDEDYDLVTQFKWTTLNGGSGKRYATTSVKKGQTVSCRTMKYYMYGKYKVVSILLHWLILNAQNGSEIDHIDGNPLNNQKCNLRLCTHSQNQQNRSKQRNNTSGYKGVYLDKRDGAWYFQVVTKRKQLATGRFKTPLEAAIAYDEASKEYFGEFARLNFP